MKKIIILYTLILLMIFIPTINAETTDTKAPVISSVNLTKTNYTAGDKISFNFDATDDVSGIFDIVVTFIDANDSTYDSNNGFILNLDLDSNGMWSATLPKKLAEGQYTFYELFIEDNVRNEQWYTKYETFRNGIVTDFNLPTINVNASKEDLEGPILKSVSFSKLVVEPNEKITITAEVSDPSGVNKIHLYYSGRTFFLEKVSDTIFKGEEYLSTPGTYKLDEFQIFDNKNNLSIYYYKNKEAEKGYMNDSNRYFTLENGAYDITVKGTPDKEKPKLDEIILPVKKVKAPTVFKFYIKASDDVTKNLQVSATIKKQNCQGFCGNIETNLIGKENDKYIIEANINQYVEPGTYIISQVSIYDDVGNHVSYTTEANEMPIHSFEVEKDVESNVVTSTTTKDFITQLEKAEDNDIISVDISNNTKISKKVFETIKGTNKTISLETNGIRWIFNGKDITNPKEIDASVEIFYVNEYKHEHWHKNKKALIIKFKENGQLPGKALIRIKADYAFREYLGDKALKLYYYNKSENFDLISKGIKVSKEGYYEFYIEHNSEYFLTNNEVEEKQLGKDYTEKLGNNKLNQKIEQELETKEDEDKQDEQTPTEKKEEKKEQQKKEESSSKSINGILNKVTINIIILIVIISIISLGISYLYISIKK